MALGNNLKRIKKDSLIPDKKDKEKAIDKLIKPSTPPTKAKKKPVDETPIAAPVVGEQILFGGKEDSTFTAKLIPSRRKAVRKTKLIIEGGLGILEAQPIMDCLQTTFNAYDIIDIQLLNITQLDLIPLQLIKSFIAYYPEKTLKVDSELPFDIKLIVERAGFASLMFKEEPT